MISSNHCSTSHGEQKIQRIYPSKEHLPSLTLSVNAPLAPLRLEFSNTESWAHFLQLSPNPKGWDGRKSFLDMAYSDAKEIALWSYWHHLETWLAYRHLPNIYILHYSALKKNPKEEIGKLAAYLGIEVTDAVLDKIVHQTSISYMKEHNEKILGPGFGAMFEGGGNSFIHKGTNGRWQGEISDEENEQYIAYGKQRLGESEMNWLVTGENLPEKE